MNINLANIDFCPGEGGGTPSEVKLAPTTAEILLSETEKVILPPVGTDGFNKVTITHAPVEESVSATITSNGTHTIAPSEGFGAMFGVNVDVNVPIKTEVAKDITITENGNTTYTPNEGEVFNSVSVDVNVPIKEEVTKDITITENGNTTYTPNEGEVFNSVSVDVNVPSKTEVTKDITITQNGNTTYTPNEGEVFNSVSVDVNVPVKEETTKEVTITSNGLTTITPPAEKTLSKVDVNVNVPIKTEVAKDIAIVKNGKTAYTPNEGEVFNSVSVDVNVPSKPEVAKDIVITENGNTTYTPNEGEVFNSVSVDVNVPTTSKTEVAKDIVITENGKTTYTPNEGEVFNSVSVDVNVPSNNYDIGSPEWVKDMKNKCVELKTSDSDQCAYILPQYASIVDGDGVIPKKNNNNENILDANGNIIYEGDLILPRGNYEYYPLRDDMLIDQFISKEYSNLYETSYSAYKIQSQNTIGVRYPFFRGQAEMYYVPATIFPVMYDAFRENKTLFGIENAIMLGRFSGTGTHEDPIELQSDQYWDVPNFQKNICNREGVEFGGWIKVSEQALINSIFPYDFPSIEISVTTGYYNSNRVVSPLPDIISKINKIEITGKNINLNYFCKNLTKLTAIYEFDSSNVINMDLMFQGCTSLVSLPKIDATKLTNSTTMFGYAYEDLPNLTTLGGLTGLKIDLSLSPCPNLTKESLLNVFNEAADVTSSPKTLTLGTKNLNKLTAEEKAIATNKGWVLK